MFVCVYLAACADSEFSRLKFHAVSRCIGRWLFQPLQAGSSARLPDRQTTDGNALISTIVQLLANCPSTTPLYV